MTLVCDDYLAEECEKCTSNQNAISADNHGNRHHKWTYYILLIPVVLLTFISAVKGQLEYDWYREQTFMQYPPLWYNFDNDVVVRTYYGDVRGFSVPWHIEDELFYDPTFHYMPRWFLRRVNTFLGIPYAEPPVGSLRFQRPYPPRWGGTWNSQYYRPACPQDISYLQQYIPTFTARNVSEDCLYLNIFSPNVTAHSRRTLYPVLVWFHPGEFVRGSAQMFPGHVLATKMMVVVTVNYRLGPFGFFSTEDEHAPGNWGLFDQTMALEFVRDNIRAFKGDPQKITIAGSEAGAASVGLHMVSPVSRRKEFFHKAIMMSGSDMSRFAYIDPFYRPREYAFELADRLDCPTDDSWETMKCMRDNNTRTWQNVLYHASKIVPHDGRLGRIWGPTQDAGYERIYHNAFLPELPINLRMQNRFDKIPVIMGVNRQDGVEFANRSLFGLSSGLSKEAFSAFMTRQLLDWHIRDLYRERAYESLEFQYTYWPDPSNSSARAQMFIDMISDLDFGAGMDFVVKQQCVYEDAYFYEFNYKSWNDWAPKWMGVGFDAITQHFFGFPFMNETVLNETELVPRQWYDYEDRNISDFVMYMFTNFAKYGIPTPNVTRNITWEPFNPHNLTYLVIDWESNLWFRYRQSKYAFWNEYFPYIARQEYYYPTATPTPAGRPYIYATGALSTLLIILLIVVGICIFLLVSESRRQRREEGDPHPSELPLSMSGTSESTMYSSRYAQSVKSSVLDEASFEGGSGSGVAYRYGTGATSKYNQSHYGYDTGRSRYESSA